MSRLSSPDAFAAARARISLVGAGPGAADLLTLRALTRIREADIVFHDRLVDAEVLALIPPCTERVNVGKDVGRCAWPQERIDAAVVTAALQGRRVVRLKSGDPSVFGRAAEEIAAARRHGIAVEVIAGVTAASAAAAATLTPMTERGRFDRFLMLTATALTGVLPADVARSLAPGMRVAIYMGVHLAGALQDSLIAAGVPPGSSVAIVQDASTRRERCIEATLSGLSTAVMSGGIRNPAVILLDIETMMPPRDVVMRMTDPGSPSAVATASRVMERDWLPSEG